MRKHRKMMQKVSIFTDKYPLLGPILWMLSIQYMITQYIVSLSWPQPYDWKNNYISDLGSTLCGTTDGLYVCSPLHAVMNASFIVFGITIALGALLIYTETKRTKLSLAGFILMVLSGIGTVMVGLFPVNENSILHVIGAGLALGVGNLSIIVLAFGLVKVDKIFRLYSFVSGSISLVALYFVVTEQYFSIGAGGMERLVSYPFVLWMISFGLYMTAVQVDAGPPKNSNYA